MDFICKVKIEQDKKEVERNELLNELLLANILPRHVADHFMMTPRTRTVSQDNQRGETSGRREGGGCIEGGSSRTGGGGIKEEGEKRHQM